MACPPADWAHHLAQCHGKALTSEDKDSVVQSSPCLMSHGSRLLNNPNPPMLLGAFPRFSPDSGPSLIHPHTRDVHFKMTGHVPFKTFGSAVGFYCVE